jgi:hypothetical protein
MGCKRLIFKLEPMNGFNNSIEQDRNSNGQWSGLVRGNVDGVFLREYNINGVSGRGSQYAERK